MITQSKTEETKDRDRGPEIFPCTGLSKLPDSVIQHYSEYRNSQTEFKSQSVLNFAFDIDARYQVFDVIGQGAYGTVVTARDSAEKDKEKALIAIKKIEKAFEHRIFAKRTLRELKILRLLNHENVIGIKRLLLPKSREEFDDVYLCQELMETDLASLIKSSHPLSYEHVQFFIYQIFRGLKYIHSAGIIHRDLKPRNILINSNCDLKICDFGLSRTMQFFQESKNMTDYVATRWYRPPELLLETKDYGSSADIWSVGCILAELLVRKPFLPGTDTKNQIELIFNVFGTPSEEDLAAIPNPRSRKFLKSLKKKNPKPLETIFPKADPIALDFLEKTMKFNPQKRMTIEEALNHPYLKELHCPDDEPVRNLVPSMEFEFEKHKLSIQQLKDLLYEEILLYHFQDFKAEYFRRVEANENPFAEIINNENALKPGEAENEEDDY